MIVHNIKLIKYLMYLNRHCILVSIIVSLISSIFISLFISTQFKKTVLNDIQVLENNIDLVSSKYSIQLLSIKNRIQAELNKGIKLRAIDLRELIIEPIPNISEVLLLDKNLYIISSLSRYEKHVLQHSLSHRHYIKKLIKDPNNIHFGKPVIGVLTKAWAIPMAVSITDQNDNFRGAVIFSIALPKFSKSVRENRLSHLLEDIVFKSTISQNGKVIDQKQLVKYAYKVFLKGILFNFGDYLFISYDSKILDDNLCLLFHIGQIKQNYYFGVIVSFIFTFCSILLLRTVMHIIQNRIVNPLKEINTIVENYIKITSTNTVIPVRNIDSIKDMNLFLIQLAPLVKNIANNNISLKQQYNIISELLIQILENIYEKQVVSEELIFDLLESINQPSSNHTEIKNLVKNSTIFTEGFIKFAVECAECIRLGQETTDLIDLLNLLFKNCIIKNYASNNLTVSLYKILFIQMLQKLKDLILSFQETVVAIKIYEKKTHVQIRLYVNNGIRVTSPAYLQDLIKLNKVAAINRALVDFHGNAVIISILNSDYA